MQYGGNAPPAPGGFGGGVRGAVQMRDRTDDIIESKWIMIVLVALIIQIAVTLVVFWYYVGWDFNDPTSLPAGFMTASFVSMVVYLVYALTMAMVLYRMLLRMNAHASRESMLRKSMIQFFRDKAAQDPNVGGRLSPMLQTMEGIDRESDSKESDKGALVWVLLAILFPILVIIPLYFLTKFDTEHDRRWHAFTQQAQFAASEVGMELQTPQWAMAKDRPWILFALLTILFWPIVIYWMYISAMDLNEHLTAQWRFEDAFLQAMD